MAKRGQSKAKSSHGGARSGSGRKPKDFTKVRAEILAETDKVICDNLPQLIKNMIFLANGGFERVEEKWGLPEVPPPPERDDDGHEVVPQAALVLVEQRREIAEPDRAANQYLIDRILGKPKQAVEMSGPGGGVIPLAVEAAIAKVYGEGAAT